MFHSPQLPWMQLHALGCLLWTPSHAAFCSLWIEAFRCGSEFWDLAAAFTLPTEFLFLIGWKRPFKSNYEPLRVRSERLRLFGGWSHLRHTCISLRRSLLSDAPALTYSLGSSDVGELIIPCEKPPGGDGGGGGGTPIYFLYRDVPKVRVSFSGSSVLNRVYNFKFSCLKQGRPRKSSPVLPLRSYNFRWFRAPSLECVKTQTYVPFVVFKYGLLGPVLNRVRNYSTFS